MIEKSDKSQTLRLSWLPLTIAVMVPLVLIAVAASPEAMNFGYVIFAIPLLLLIWIGLGVWSCFKYVRLSRDGHRRQALVAAVLPGLVAATLLSPLGFVRECNYVGDVLHFVLARDYYDRRVAALPPEDHPRIAVFNRGGMIWASRGVVYDESDQVALPQGRQSPEWQANPYRGELACRGYKVRPLWAHYYLGYFPC